MWILEMILRRDETQNGYKKKKKKEKEIINNVYINMRENMHEIVTSHRS